MREYTVEEQHFPVVPPKNWTKQRLEEFKAAMVDRKFELEAMVDDKWLAEQGYESVGQYYIDMLLDY